MEHGLENDERRFYHMRGHVAIILLMLAMSIPYCGASTTSTTALGWAASYGGNTDETLGGFDRVENGSFWGGGSFDSQIELAGAFHEATGLGGDVDAWVALLDPEGGVGVNVTFGSDGVDRILDVVSMPDGVVVVGSHCIGTRTEPCSTEVGGITLSKASDDDDGNAFIGRLDQNGAWLWFQDVPTSEATRYEKVVRLANGDLLAVLRHSERISLGSEVVDVRLGNALLLVRYSPDGTILGSSSLDSDEILERYEICEDAYGGAVVVGSFLGDLLAEPLNMTSSGAADGFVASLGFSSTWDWIAQASGQGDQNLLDCAVERSGLVHVVGSFDNEVRTDARRLASGWVDMFHARLETGSWIETVTLGAGGHEELTHIQLDERGGAFMVGTMTQRITIGQDVLEPKGTDGRSRDLVLMRRASDGVFDWSTVAGGAEDDRPAGLVLDGTANPLVGIHMVASGTYSGHELTHAGNGDLGFWSYGVDLDEDGVTDGADLCPRTPNPDQANHDGDSLGDVCDDDDDGDGVIDAADACPLGLRNWISSGLSDHDRDGCRDLDEDHDDDEDGIADENDLCRLGPVGWVSTPEDDIESDGCSDVDSDGDGIVDQADVCPGVADVDQADLDGDGLGDACDPDADGDGIEAPLDLCPRDLPWTSNASNDHDGDGCMDADMDSDDDGDGIEDLQDACPRGIVGPSNGTTDHDGDGCHDPEDDDDDDDGASDADDGCPRGRVGARGFGVDVDDDGCHDALEDLDDDGDGIEDSDDLCPRTPLGVSSVAVGTDGCTPAERDADEDGVSDVDDFCVGTSRDVRVDESGCEIIAETTITEATRSRGPVGSGILLMVLLLVAVAGAMVAYRRLSGLGATASRNVAPTVSRSPHLQMPLIHEEE